MTYRDLGDTLFDYALQENAAGTSDLATPRMKAAAARVISAALREIRGIRKNLFKRRKGWTLNAPQAITFTVGTGGYNVSSLSPVAPNSGCTVRTGSLQVDIHATASGGAGGYIFDVQHPTGGGLTGTLYHDCVLVHRGLNRGTSEDLFESVVGEVRFNRRPLVLAKNVEEVERRLSVSGDYGQQGGRVRMSRLPVGDPTYCWLEVFNVDSNQTELRLRVAPLPSASGTLEAVLVAQPVELVAADLDITTKTFGLPGNMDADVLAPIALKRWMATPFCSVKPDQAREIERQFEVAMKTLSSWRGANSRSAVAVATDQ